jgi:hypothetical protein
MAEVDPSELPSAFQSTVDVSFWAELGALKLDKLRLSEEAQAITGEKSSCT